MRNHIPYPTKRNEAEIQALLWYFLKKRKLDVRLEVFGFYESNDSEEQGHCILDMVVFQDKVPVIIIEVKSWSNSYARSHGYRKGHNTRQIQRYAGLFRLPVLIIGRINEIDNTIAEIERILGIKTTYPHIS